MTKIGDVRKPSGFCVKWKHDKSKCHDTREKRTIEGRTYDVWVCHCVELNRISKQVLGQINKILK